MTYFAPELYAKRLELLKAVVPDLKRIALLVEPVASKKLTEMYVRASMDAAKKLGLDVTVVEANTASEIEQAFGEMSKSSIQAVHVLAYQLFSEEVSLIASLAMMHDLPTMHFLHEYCAAGGLMGFGPDYPTLRKRQAHYVDKILKGARPGDLPVEQPMRFQFKINLSKAHELGLKVPSSVLLRADQVIE